MSLFSHQPNILTFPSFYCLYCVSRHSFPVFSSFSLHFSYRLFFIFFLLLSIIFFSSVSLSPFVNHLYLPHSLSLFLTFITILLFHNRCIVLYSHYIFLFLFLFHFITIFPSLPFFIHFLSLFFPLTSSLLYFSLSLTLFPLTFRSKT